MTVAAFGAAPNDPPSGSLDATIPASGAALVASADAGRHAQRALDHFRIEGKLGAGGMGEVYLAHDVSLD
ncbi:MAG TPA: hypothetical protein VHB21_10000, partial [Minicystis sp.]|nr:hypothetical protein [Minicystis sp.]